MKRPQHPVISLFLLALIVFVWHGSELAFASDNENSDFDRLILKNSKLMIKEGRATFRFDTFGDEAYWGDTLKLHQAIQGAKFGGVGNGLSPRTALAVGLKIDVDSLPKELIGNLKKGRVNLDDPATTLALLNHLDCCLMRTT